MQFGFGLCKIKTLNLLFYLQRDLSKARKLLGITSFYLPLIFNIGIDNCIDCDQNYRNKNEK